MKFDKGPDLRLSLSPEEQDYAVLKTVLSEIRRGEQPGWGLEFGVATGTTLRMIARVMPVIGFDSFVGLPEDWRPGFPAGFFKGVRPENTIPNSTLVEGWFDVTVPDYPWPEDIALVHIDSDLYSSAKTVFDSVGPAIHPGTYVVFDEFFGYEGCEEHEQKAFSEWVDTYGVEYEVIGHGREQWAVRIS